MAGWDFDVFQALYPEWDTSGWEVVVIQSGPRKVHLAVQVDRYDAEGNVFETFQTLHIMTNQDGHWGTQARSSFASL
jgi:hypothetical protein